MFVLSTSENWKLGARSVLCVGRNCKKQGGGTGLVSSWSEFSTKAGELFLFFPSSKEMSSSSSNGAPGATDPRNSEAAPQYPHPCPVQWRTAPPGGALDGAQHPQEKAPAGGYRRGSHFGAWKRLSMGSPRVAVQVCHPLLNPVLRQTLANASWLYLHK